MFGRFKSARSTIFWPDDKDKTKVLTLQQKPGGQIAANGSGLLVDAIGNSVVTITGYLVGAIAL